MGRWTQYDEDEHRLPEGMKRVGYDADTQQYTFQKGNELWVGEPGAEYGGSLTRAGAAPEPPDEDEGDLESGIALGRRSDGYQPLSPDVGMRPAHSNRAAYRAFLPFILLIGVFLLFIWRFIVGHTPHVAPSQMCVVGNSTYRVEKGDSCWWIAHTHGTSVDRLQNQTVNPGLDCTHLRPGDVLCIP